MSADADRRLLVAAIGNRDRGDDGVGPAIADRIAATAPAGVRVLQCGGDVLELLDEWAEAGGVILIDASNHAGEAGRIRRLDLMAEALPADFAQNSTHAFGLAETVELARALGRLPDRLVVYLVEGAQFEVGRPLSPPVAEAIEKAAEAVLAEASRMAAERQS